MRPRSHPLALIIALLLLSGASWADSEFSTYAFGNVFVFDTLATDGSRKLNVVSLDDDSSLKVIGQVNMPGHSSYIGTFSNYKDKLIVLLWDRVEIYDLTKPTSPTFVKAFELKNQGFSSPGYPRIEAAGDNRFILMNTVNTSELRTEGEVQNWKVTAMALTPEIKAKMTQRSLADDFEVQAQPSLLVKDTGKFRYELIWKNKQQRGLVTHAKYLRKVDKVSGRTLASLSLGTVQETID